MVLLAGAILFVLIAAEAAVRILARSGPRPTGYAPVDTNRRAARPVNAKGYRDLARAVPKPPGVHRVLSLGDSFAWGASVEFEDAYPQRLERALTRRRHETWEVVNLALPGMATVDHAAQLEKEGEAYGPDVVLLGFVLNDSQDATAAEAQRAEDWVNHPPPASGRSALLGMIRTRLTKDLSLRQAPFIRFALDEDLKKELQMMELLDQVARENAELDKKRAEQAGNETPPEA